MKSKYEKKFEKSKNNKTEAFEEFKRMFFEDDILSYSVSNLLDKSYYEDCDEIPENWFFPDNKIKSNIQWQRVTNLPTGMFGDSDIYRSNERMQNFICAEHALNHTLGFLMLRQDSYTNLYFGATSDKGGSQVPIQMRENIQINLMGTRLENVASGRRNIDSVERKLMNLPYCGVITGQPSVRANENENPLQTLDRLTSGILNYETNLERDYAILVISKPVRDSEVKEIFRKMQNTKSELHEFASCNETIGLQEGESVGQSKGFSGSIGTGILSIALTAACATGGAGILAGALGAASVLGGSGLGGALGNFNVGASRSRFTNQNVALTNSITREHVNYSVKYCEELIDKAIKRLEQGRNLGFWNTEVYVLGDSSATVELVMAELRSIYAGENTYQEPIRTFNFGRSQSLRRYIDDYQLLPLPVESDKVNDINIVKEKCKQISEDDCWHKFGKIYEYMSTPMNTEELSIVMSLPKKDVAGIHIKRDAVEFATNPPLLPENVRTIDLGKIIDMGSSTGHSYLLDIDQLNRHGLIVGLNGGGKSVTSKTILTGMIRNKIPFMIIDPVKTDYAVWADSYNQMHKKDPGFKPIKIIAPGLKKLNGIETKLFDLKMNPFKPCAAKGAKLDMQGHIGNLLGLLNRTMAMGDFLPMILEELVYSFIEAKLHNADFIERADIDPSEINECDYPKLSEILEPEILDRLFNERNYSAEKTSDFTAAIKTRINALTRGWKKDFFESDYSTAPEEIFEENVVICLAGVADNKDKAFFMSLLLNAASEYRLSRYQYDDNYRNTVTQGRKKYRGNYLAHYTVVEEAHRILQVSNTLSSDADPKAAAAEKFCEMLSEIRESGEGMMIIDQYPSRLIADSVKNTNLKIIHRLQALDDRTAMAGCMSLNNNQSTMLALLKKGDAIISSEQDDAAMWLHINMADMKGV